MAVQNTATVNSDWSGGFFQELWQSRVYKPMLGRVARQATCGAIWLAFALLAWRWYETRFLLNWFDLGVEGSGQELRSNVLGALRYVFPGALLAFGLWAGYRAVNVPRFADFLIAVEAEMNKVTWPSQGELVRSSLVVILLLAALTILLFLFDTVWYAVFFGLGIR
jgi:preprotein translocase subunit SecE